MADRKSETTFTPAETEEVRARVREIMAAEGMSQADIARAAGVAYGTFTGWLAGTYNGVVDRYTADVQIWLSAREENRRAASTVPQVPGFKMTKSATDFIDALRFSQILPEIGVIAGGAGIGKSTTCQHYEASNPNVWLATMQPSSRSVYPMLGEIAEVMGIEEKVMTRLPRAIGRKVDGRGGLIIIDEAQHLDVNALEQLRSLYDKYRVGIALVGNESVYARLEGKGREAGFAQLYSRVGVRVTQSKPRAADMCVLIEAWGVSDKEEIRFLKGIASKPGALRSMTKTLQIASMLALGADQERTIKHIKAAWTRLSTSSDAA